MQFYISRSFLKRSTFHICGVNHRRSGISRFHYFSSVPDFAEMGESKIRDRLGFTPHMNYMTYILQDNSVLLSLIFSVFFLLFLVLCYYLGCICLFNCFFLFPTFQKGILLSKRRNAENKGGSLCFFPQFRQRMRFFQAL